MTEPGDVERGSGDYLRQESQAHQLDRNWAELVQELRVIGTGVQISSRSCSASPSRPASPIPRDSSATTHGDPHAFRSSRRHLHCSRCDPPSGLPLSGQRRSGECDQRSRPRWSGQPVYGPDRIYPSRFGLGCRQPRCRGLHRDHRLPSSCRVVRVPDVASTPGRSGVLIRSIRRGSISWPI